MLQPARQRGPPGGVSANAAVDFGHLAVRDPNAPKDHLDDLLDAHLANCQRRSAQRMLQDFEKTGVDEDLEQLKAGWAPSFGHRPGFVPPRQTASIRENPGKAICAGVSGTQLSSGRLADRSVLNGSGSSLHVISKTAGNCTFGKQSSASDEESVSKLALQAELAKDRLYQLEALRSIAGPMDGEDGNTTSASSKPCFLPKRKCKTRVTSSDDPWDSWESRWSQEFQDFEELERAKRTRSTAESDAEYSRREAQWHRKVEGAKRQAEEAAQRRREAQPREDSQPEPEKPRARPRQRPPPQPPPDAQGSSSSSEQRFRQPPPQPPPDSQRSSGSSEQRSRRRHESSQKPAPNGGLPNPPPKVSPPAAAQARPEPSITAFVDFDIAWSQFEQRISAGQPVRCSEIPWPMSLPTISGAQQNDSPAERKRKLRAALVRWHPDKWGVIFGLVCQEDQQLVMEKVKEVTRRIIEERKTFGG